MAVKIDPALRERYRCDPPLWWVIVLVVGVVIAWVVVW